MVIGYRDLLEAIYELAEEKEVRTTIECSGLGALAVAGSAFTGGLMKGPAGLAVGGILGALGAYAILKDSFRSLPDVIKNDLSDEQKRRLVQHVNNAIDRFNITDVSKIFSNETVQNTIVQSAIAYVSKQLDLQFTLN